MGPGGKVGLFCTATLAWLLGQVPACSAEPAAGEKASEPAATEAAAPASGPRLKLGVEAKLNFRHSEDNRFAVPFPFTPDQLPVGQTRGFEETVNAGSHAELSNLTLLGDAVWGPAFKAHGKLDIINLYYRNPTSTDKKFDVSELWLRLGRETSPATLPSAGSGAAHWGLYLKVGKFPKFERQNDRHLESYGLVSTAFNRFEDIGAELGVDLGRHLYVKVSGTEGNPVFLRDPNALAGDNGTPELQQLHPDPTIKTGISILYDTHVEDLSVNHPQVGGAIGLRFADDAGKNGVDLLAWGRRRTLAPKVDFEGSSDGGDLAILRAILPITNDRKQEAGGNLWLYLGDFSLFGQFVDQKLAGLPRRGYEGEAAWRFDLPLAFALNGQQLLTSIAPAVRYSKLDNGFRNLVPTPWPSFAWNWNKLDGGARLGIIGGLDLTVEYARNTFTLVSGAKGHNNELLSTFRLRV